MPHQTQTKNMSVPRLLLTLCLILIFCVAANATMITVTNTNDGGEGSLRQAIIDAASGDTINFSSGLSGSVITLTSGQLLIDKDLTIQGPGASMLSINGNNASRVFLINSGSTAKLDGITITGGYSSFGSGIRNNGRLEVSNSIISGNNAAPDDGQLGYGGGIVNSGWLTISNSTISNNHAYLYGGGIYNSGPLTVINSTLSGNMGSSGGGISTVGPTTIFDSTISGNAGGGISTIFGAPTTTETLKNTIVAGNVGGDIGTTVETASHNVIGDFASSGGDTERRER
jgi:hypothetical protein